MVSDTQFILLYLVSWMHKESSNETSGGRKPLGSWHVIHVYLPSVKFWWTDTIIRRCNLKICNFCAHLEPPQSSRAAATADFVFLQLLLVISLNIDTNIVYVILLYIFGICFLNKNISQTVLSWNSSKRTKHNHANFWAC